MKNLNMEKIARGLSAERVGKVSAQAGYFGALQLVADIEARFRVPEGGGRPTDPQWTERRLLPLTHQTLGRLEEMTAKVCKQGKINVEPMQLAALLLEKTIKDFSEERAKELVRPQRKSKMAG